MRNIGIYRIEPIMPLKGITVLRMNCFLHHILEGIENESRRQVTRLDNIRYGRVIAHEPREATINSIPLCYVPYEPPRVNFTDNV